MTHELRLQSLFRPIDSLRSGPVSYIGCDFQHDLLGFSSAFPVRNQNVDVAARIQGEVIDVAYARPEATSITSP